ncbi:MAG: 5-(carboxyamino)imidazole ribonucleotide synthase, partial [Candidatus Eremiobacteraeota bacterium]|nr:5-(carboxyamino)imidazole ribonucleotide synthase [Candidatus Eremiobacteraeota bacterium]
MIQSIGVIGGGQLGRMFALDAKRMGYNVVVLDPQPHSPCGQVADEQIVAEYGDLAAIEALGKRTDIVTYEFENIAIESVRHLERLGYSVTPSSKVLAVTQDRLLEKRFLRAIDIPVGAFEAVDREEDLARAAASVGFPAVLKTVRGGYDGKGQWRVDDAAGAENAFAQANGASLIWERFIPFQREISVVSARTADDETITYPPSENMHDDGILVTSIVPARVPPEVAEQARATTETIARNLRIVGTFCVEFFVTTDGELLVNEIAPRPHNSGHYTMDATPCSQYEQHIRAICALPLSPPQLLRNAIMMNVLGEGHGDTLAGVDRLLTDPSIVLHVYGKKHAVLRRKMGHFTMLLAGPADEPAIHAAQAAKSKLHWEPQD